MMVGGDESSIRILSLAEPPAPSPHPSPSRGGQGALAQTLIKLSNNAVSLWQSK
jgi:hypothetical protein